MPNPAALSLEEVIESGGVCYYVYCRPVMPRKKGQARHRRELTRILVTFLRLESLRPGIEQIVVRYEDREVFLSKALVSLEPFRDGTFCCNHFAPLK